MAETQQIFTLIKQFSNDGTHTKLYSNRSNHLGFGMGIFLDPPLIGLIYLEQDHYQVKIM